MSDELRLECLPSDSPDQGACLLCGEIFESAGTLAMLWDGQMPLGYLCGACAASPRRAAKRVRQRVKEILSLLKPGLDDGSHELSLRRLQLIRLRADFWKAMARRIEKLDSWE